MAKKTNAMELVLLRNVFYRDNYHRVVLVLFFVIAINVLLVGIIFFRLTHPPKPLYYPITPDGVMIRIHPLTDPVVSDDYALQWSANAVRKAFSLDFVHWREQLQQASEKFTPDGWQYFSTALKASRNLETLTNLKMVSDAQITGVPQILQKQVISDRFAWKIEMPILLTFQNADKTIPMSLKVTLIVMRVSEKDNPDRIAINNFLPEVQATTEQPG